MHPLLPGVEKRLQDRYQLLGGRPFAWGKEFSEEALQAVLWVLGAMIAVLQEGTADELRQTADFIQTGSG
jgi:hypothetical protein